jgi:hypothetical protein
MINGVISCTRLIPRRMRSNLPTSKIMLKKLKRKMKKVNGMKKTITMNMMIIAKKSRRE